MSIYLKRRRKSKSAIYSLAAVRISDLCDIATPDLTRHDKYTNIQGAALNTDHIRMLLSLTACKRHFGFITHNFIIHHKCGSKTYIFDYHFQLRYNFLFFLTTNIAF